MAIPDIIKQYANYIRTKIYGKEVRESLARGIEVSGEISEEANSRSKNTEVRQTILEKKYDDQIANMTNENPSISELVDFRTSSVTGKTYGTAGERADEIDTQLVNIATTPKNFGAVGDGVTFDDLAFSKARDYAITSGINKIVITKGDYLLNDIFVLDSLNGFEIEILTGARLFTKKHGWGVIEVVRSKNILIHGAGKIEGSNTYVDKNFNSTKGGGEKHATNNAGYQWGAYRNDSLTALGAFGGGYIGNSGIGILIHDGCKNVTVKGLDISGFNYSGIHVGFRGDTSEQELNFCENIRIQCYIHDCYSTGIEFYSVDGIDTSGSIVEDIGHPDALPTDPVIDPGYGIAATAVSDINTQSRNVKVSFCIIRRTKRKGVDTHASNGLQISNNLIEDTLVNGIGLTGSTEVKKNVDVMYNTLIRCGVADGDGATVDLLTGITNKYEYANISKNRLVDCGTNTEIYSESNYTKVDNNILESTAESGKSAYHTGIDITSGKGVSVKGNILKGKYKRGIRFGNGVEGQFDGNEVDITWSTNTDPVLFENSKVTLGQNNLNKIVTSNGNSLNSRKNYSFLVEYSTTRSIPLVTLLNGGDIPYEVLNGGSGTIIRFNVGFDIIEKSFSLVSYASAKNTNLSYLAMLKAVSSGIYNDFTISPRRSDNTIIPNTHADINGLKIIVDVNLVGIA